MKLNNKGYLIVEIVLSATIAFAIMYFLIDLTFNFKSKSDDLYKETIFIADKNIITKTVMDDINSMPVSKIDFSCNQGNYRCVDITYQTNDTKITKRFGINTENKNVQYGTIENGTYNKTDYYYEKDLSSDLTIGTVSIENNCYGTNVVEEEDANQILICNPNNDDSDILKNNGLVTINFNATSQFLENDYGINITIPYNNIEVTIDIPPCFNYQNAPTSPELPDGMIPIKFDGEVIKKADINNQDNDWYNYYEGKWANAVMVNSETRTNYMNATAGTTITSSNILAYYVWIPRYSYELFSENQTTMKQICINFENSTDTKQNGNKEGSLLTHPSFTFGNTEQNGIWVSKFKSTGSIESPTAKPNAGISKLALISRQYQQSQKFNDYLTTTGQNNYDVHMLKNTDWGAISYLAYSQYGICNNGDSTCNSIEANTTDYSGGGSGWMTQNTNQSTTNNIYGVYDMKSSKQEHVMGNFGVIVGQNLEYPYSADDKNYNHSNFIGQIYNTNADDYISSKARNTKKCRTVGDSDCYYEGIKNEQDNYYGSYGEPIEFPSNKYYDLYELTTQSGDYDKSLAYIKGDATYEIKNLEEITNSGSWITDSECMTEPTNFVDTIPGCTSFHTWYARGNANSIFYFKTTQGSGNTYTARSVITKK